MVWTRWITVFDGLIREFWRISSIIDIFRYFNWLTDLPTYLLTDLLVDESHTDRVDSRLKFNKEIVLFCEISRWWWLWSGGVSFEWKRILTISVVIVTVANTIVVWTDTEFSLTAWWRWRPVSIGNSDREQLVFLIAFFTWSPVIGVLCRSSLLPFPVFTGINVVNVSMTREFCLQLLDLGIPLFLELQPFPSAVYYVSERHPTVFSTLLCTLHVDILS